MAEAAKTVLELAVTDFAKATGPEAVSFRMGQLEERAKSQAFFAELARDIRAPHTGDAHRATINGILQRAQQVGLYAPEES